LCFAASFDEVLEDGMIQHFFYLPQLILLAVEANEQGIELD